MRTPRGHIAWLQILICVALVSVGELATGAGIIEKVRAVCTRGYSNLLEARWSKVVGPKVAPDFAKTTSELRVKPAVRDQIQNLKDELLTTSASDDFYGHPVCLTQNHCHGASHYFRKVLREKLVLDAKIVTFEPRKANVGGFEHSFVIIPDYFGTQSPLVIDPTIKQFMDKKHWGESHDIFVGSPSEYLEYMKRYGVSRNSDGPELTFEHMMRAEDSGRFEQ
ncbi:hypothetical protein BH10BDE1_BH10BDE1_18070 [soil metagenome]